MSRSGANLKKFYTNLTTSFKKFLEKHSPDLIAMAGLGLLGYGIYQRCVWLSWVVVGGALLTFGIMLGLRK
jgi:hypothetical protein